MAYKSTFKRYELKYKITRAQKEKLLDLMKSYMTLDEYGHSTIRNIYFDTDDYRLIRTSIDKPVYKEKLRVRSYEKANKKTKVFVELKKKYDHVVYKRRVCLPEKEAVDWLSGKKHCGLESQIVDEIDYVLDHYNGLKPVLFLSYEREAFYSNDGSDFRVTFDENILCHQNNLSLEDEAYGKKILDDELVLMELKCSGGLPLWMTSFLSKEKIFKTSFSKYGTAYKNHIAPKITKKHTTAREKKVYVHVPSRLALQASVS